MDYKAYSCYFSSQNSIWVLTVMLMMLDYQTLRSESTCCGYMVAQSIHILLCWYHGLKWAIFEDVLDRQLFDSFILGLPWWLIYASLAHSYGRFIWSLKIVCFKNWSFRSNFPVNYYSWRLYSRILPNKSVELFQDGWAICLHVFSP